MLSHDKWFDEWNTESLYQKEVDNCDDCVNGSPIGDNGIICGPILRLRKVDYKTYTYNGSILVITKNGDSKSAPKIEYEIGPSYPSKANGNPQCENGEFDATCFYNEKWNGDDFQFFRYSIVLSLTGMEQMVKYTISNSYQPHYRFFIPSKTTNFNTISYSCNGFSLSVDTSKFKGSLWYDILNKHSKIRYNVMLGGGDQIYADCIKIYCEKVEKWLKTRDPITKYMMKADTKFKTELNQFYLKAYMEWYGYGHWKGSTETSKTTQKCFPIAMATIPSINIWDDHDIIDGFGSYSDTLMKSDVFSSIGKSAYKYYMIFQHHVSLDERAAYMEDSIWILGKTPGPYIQEVSHSVFTRLGPTMGLLGLDCRTERSLKEILSKDTYDVVFERLSKEVKNQKLDHLLLMLGVPIAYPRLVLLEWLFSSRLLAPIKSLSKKGIMAKGLVNEFNGDVELLDDLNDHWCARHHKKERNGLVARLQDFGAKNGVRITILSGDVHLASVGRFKSKKHKHHIFNSKEKEKESEIIEDEPENDLRLMFNVISSAVVNTPPPNPMVKLLQSKAGIHHFDRETDEDAVPIFKKDVNDDSSPRKETCFLNRRNWSDIIPVENAFANEYLSTLLKAKVGDVIMPGIVTKTGGMNIVKNETSKDSSNHGYSTYPITQNGVIVSLNMETDATNPKSITTRYCLPIPELRKTCDSLSHSGLKHWNFK